MVNGRVVKVREWLTLCVPFPVMYRMYRQLVTAIMTVVSGNKQEMGEESVYWRTRWTAARRSDATSRRLAETWALSRPGRVWWWWAEGWGTG